HDYHDFSEDVPMAYVTFGKRCDVKFRNHQQMHRRMRLNIMKGEDVVVLVHFFGGQFAARDLAENAARVERTHRFSSAIRASFPRAAFSSKPDKPSRRASSASTSSGRRP